MAYCTKCGKMFCECNSLVGIEPYPYGSNVNTFEFIPKPIIPMPEPFKPLEPIMPSFVPLEPEFKYEPPPPPRGVVDPHLPGMPDTCLDRNGRPGLRPGSLQLPDPFALLPNQLNLPNPIKI